MDIETKCPKCDETSKFGLNLASILNALKVGDYDSELEVNDLYVRYRPLKYKDFNQFNIQEFEFQKILNTIATMSDMALKEKKNNDAIKASLEMQIERIAASIECIKTPETIVTNKEYIKEFLYKCSIDYFQKIKNKYHELKESTQTKPLQIKCTSCSYDYEQPILLNYCEYFRAKLLYMEPENIQKWIEDMEKEVNEIKSSALKMSWYMRGGITFNDILLLSDKERETISELIKENLETTKKTQLPFF